MSISSLLNHDALWRASNIHCDQRGLATGYAELDQYLPGQGWTTNGVTELLHDHHGIGELRLLGPALSKLSLEQDRWVLWVCPPYIPYPPALSAMGIDLRSVIIAQPETPRDFLWVLEAALASGTCSAVLAWPKNIQEKQIRRLQVACKTGSTWNILFRPSNAAGNASPAELRISLKPTEEPLHTKSSISLKIIKRRGGWGTDTFSVKLKDDLNRETPYLPDLQALLPDNNRIHCMLPLHEAIPTLTSQNEFKLQ